MSQQTSAEVSSRVSRGPGSAAGVGTDAGARAGRRVYRALRNSRLTVVATVFGLIATLISLIGSWIPSLWGDEAASVMSAQRSLPSLAMMLTHVDAVHGTYYFGLHFWIAAFGSSPFSVRLPSALAVGFTVAAVVVLCDRLRGRNVAVIAGIVCCVLPRVTYMGEEARSYAFSAAIAAWLTVVLIELLRKHQRPHRLWLAYGLLLAFGIYVFLYVALIPLAHLVILLRQRESRRFLRTWVRVVIVSVVAASPLAFVAFGERKQIAYLATKPQVSAQSIFVALWFGSWPFAVVAWALIAFALWVVIRDLTKRRLGRMMGDSEPVKRPLPRLELVAAAWLLIPSALLIGSQFVFAGFTGRYLSYAAPAAAILIACGISALGQSMRTRPRRWLQGAALALILALAVPVYLSQRGPFSKNDSDWAQVSAIVGAHARPGDGIVFDESVSPSKRPRLALHTYPNGFTGLVDFTLVTPFTQNTTWYDRAMSVDSAYAADRTDGLTRIWVVEYAVPGHVDTYGIDSLTDHGYHQSAVHYDAFRAVIYEFTR
jgi:mannosyltransferase